jgi:hypothetical protein
MKDGGRDGGKERKGTQRPGELQSLVITKLLLNCHLRVTELLQRENDTAFQYGTISQNSIETMLLAVA